MSLPRCACPPGCWSTGNHADRNTLRLLSVCISGYSLWTGKNSNHKCACNTCILNVHDVVKVHFVTSVRGSVLKGTFGLTLLAQLASLTSVEGAVLAGEGTFLTLAAHSRPVPCAEFFHILSCRKTSNKINGCQYSSLNIQFNSGIWPQGAKTGK